jgi:hypothetical protein
MIDFHSPRISLRQFHIRFGGERKWATANAAASIMGTNANNSVVGVWQKSHDPDNLYIVGRGFLPGIGTDNRR